MKVQLKLKMVKFQFLVRECHIQRNERKANEIWLKPKKMKEAIFIFFCNFCVCKLCI